MIYLMSVVAISLLQFILSGTLLSFLVIFPYYTAYQKKEDNSLETLNLRKPQIKKLDMIRKGLNLIFGLVYIGFSLMIIIVSN